MNSSSRKTSLRLLDYYIIEALHAFAVFLFLLSVFFWSKEKFGFSDIENLVLGAGQGVCYIISAWICGRLADRLGYNRMLVAGLIGMACVLLAASIPDWRGTPYVTLWIYVTFMGSTWASIQSGTMHLPGRINMPRRLGIYNLVWSFSGAAGFFFSGFVFTRNPDTILWISGGIHVVQVGWILYHRGRHRIEGSSAMTFPHRGDAHSPEAKRTFRNMSWLSNGLCFFIAGSFSALTPHLGVKHGLSQAWSIWLGSSLLAARAVSFILFSRWEGWHYERKWSLIALWFPSLFIAVAFFSPDIVSVVAAVVLLGFTLGLNYYKSIYYSLDSSDNKGEQGGLHEAIIGLGLLIGPLAGAVGGRLTGSTAGAKATIVAGAILVAFLGFIAFRRRGAGTSAS